MDGSPGLYITGISAARRRRNGPGRDANRRFVADKMDDALGLKEKGLTSVVIAAVGYRSADDANAKLPKSRFEQGRIITRL